MSKPSIRLLIEILFLILFAFLFFQGNLQVWVLLWFAGILASFIFSRVYCGWMCPIATIMRFQSWIYDKLNIDRIKITNSSLLTVVRYILIAVFFVGMITVRVGGVRLNIILYLVTAGVALSFLFEENFWHHICPHGTVLGLSNKPAPVQMRIDEDKCTGCGLCEQVCPNQTIEECEEGIRKIDNKECLVCQDCAAVCPVDAISYGK